MGFEIEIIKSLQEISSSFFENLCKFISHISNYIGFIFVLGMFFLLYKRRYAITFAITYGISIGINFGLKYLFNRPRPYVASGEVINILPGSGASMPSGHTLSATIISVFCLYAIFKTTKNKIIRTISTILFAGFISLVMISRMYLGQHYLTDTLVGFIEGVVFSLIGIYIYKKFESKENFSKWTNL